jgi:hypothetical protein
MTSSKLICGTYKTIYQNKYIGTFKTLDEATEEYNKKALELYGNMQI